MVKVSVIIPIYNAEKYLCQCLETVLGQTLRDIEVILIDDDSTDHSYQICQEFAEHDSRIRLYGQKNRGPGATRNYGIELAQGEYLSFLDSDDFFEPNMLEILSRRAKITNADVVFCDFWHFDEYSQKDFLPSYGIREAREKYLPKTKTFTAKDCPKYIFHIDTGAVWNKLYKKNFIKNNNIKFADLVKAEDIPFSFGAFLLAKKISYVDIPLIHYRFFEKVNQYPGHVFKGMEFLKNFMRKNNIYQLYEQSFISYFVSNIKYIELEFTRYPERYFLEDIFHEYIVNWGLKKKEYSYYIYPGFYGAIDCFERKYKNNRNFKRIYGQKKNKIIPIVLSSNKNYAFAISVTIQSIITHSNKENFYDIYILHSETFDELEALESVSAPNIRITCVDMAWQIKNITFPLSKVLSHISKECYYRLFIPSILSYDKVIYLDSDLVLQTDVAQLFKIELGQNLIAGVMDVLTGSEEKERICWGLDPLCHINTGVLLINNKLWQEECIQQKCLNEICNPSYHYTLVDQDIINFVCLDRILLLDPKWNFLCAAYNYKKDRYLAYTSMLYPEECYIIHYNGVNKVWGSFPKTFLDVIWWNYARNSIFYENIMANVQKHPVKSPVPSDNKIKVVNNSQEIYQLKLAYIKEAMKYWMSFGKTKQKHRVSIDVITEKLKKLGILE